MTIVGPDMDDAAEPATGAEETRPSLQEAQIAGVAASLPGVIFSFRQTADGRRSFPYASGNCFNVFGLSPDALRSSEEAVFTRIHPEDLRHVQATIEESARSGGVWRDECRYDHPTKGLIWLEGQSSPVRDTNGDITWHGYVQDITGRKQAEKNLRISEARYRAFFKSGLIGVISWDIDGAITDANDTFLDMLGYSREDLEAGRVNWQRLTPPEFLEADRRAREQMMGFGSFRPYEKEYLRKDGSRVPILLAAESLEATHRLGVAFVLDISERKKDEARLQRMIAERFTAMKTMAAGLAHEINQPLAATVTYLRAIKRLLEMQPEQRRVNVEETLDKAVAQVARASQIVAHLRNFIAHDEPDKITAHLHDIIRDACRSTIPDADEKGLKLTLRLEAADDKVLADPVQIRQVLANLIRNAREAMTNSTRRELTVSTSSCRSEIRIDVADTGTGLAEEVKPSLFEPFTTTKAEGMGVGLAISRTIIEAHHGRIWVAASADGGTVFSCALPLADSLFDRLPDLPEN